MFFPTQVRSRTVSGQGAAAGTILTGCGGNNQGLRLRILHSQPRGADGPITGDFVILDVGDSKHSDSLIGLLDRATNAAEIVGLIRRQHPGCVSVVNTNILLPEPG